MPKYRQLHTKIVDSFDFAEMPDDFTRVTWLLMIVVMDSEGRGIDRAAWLRARIYPLRTDVELTSIEEAMNWYADRGMIVRYKVDGKSYFYIPTFKIYQTGTDKEAKSLLPAPPDLLPSNSGATPPQYNADSDSNSYSNSDSHSPPKKPAAANLQPQSNIFILYERNIGQIPQLMVDKLKAAESDYPADWIQDAFQAAVNADARSWNYVYKVLENRRKGVNKPRSTNGAKPPVDINQQMRDQVEAAKDAVMKDWR